MKYILRAKLNREQVAERTKKCTETINFIPPERESVCQKFIRLEDMTKFEEELMRGR
jgi:hypothetical protein